MMHDPKGPHAPSALRLGRVARSRDDDSDSGGESGGNSGGGPSPRMDQDLAGQDARFSPGVAVHLPDRPEWGEGQVQSVIGTKVTVMFVDGGKQIIDTAQARLETIEP